MTNMATKKKAPNKSALSERKMIRCSETDWAWWEAAGRLRGFNGAGPLLRKLGNDFIAGLPKSERDKLEAMIKAAA